MASVWFLLARVQYLFFLLSFVKFVWPMAVYILPGPFYHPANANTQEKRTRLKKLQIDIDIRRSAVTLRQVAFIVGGHTNV